jgi:hypothetical protein
MIICGFPGIGKSTLAANSNQFIDLESSCFGNPKPANWSKYYINIANHLSNQGFHVFVSSHHEVQVSLETLKTDQDILLVYPSLDLKSDWLKRLEDRYNQTKLDKDMRAYNSIKQIYEPAVKSMQSNTGIKNHVVLDSMQYNLLNSIKPYL